MKYPLFRRLNADALAKALAVVLLICSQRVSAQTAISNLGANYNSILTVGNFALLNYEQAFGFTTGSSGLQFTGVTLSAGSGATGASGFTVTLNSGFGAHGSTGVLATLSGSSAPAFFISGTTTPSYTASTPITLAPNTQYWLQLSSPTTPATTYFAMARATDATIDAGALSGWSQVGTLYQSIDEGLNFSTNASIYPQFSIQYSAVPESSTYCAVAGLGVFGFAAYRRRRQRVAVVRRVLRWSQWIACGAGRYVG